MRVVKCDSCGEIYDSYEGIHTEYGNVNGVMALHSNGKRWDKVRIFDLCPECSTRFLNMVHLPVIERSEDYHEIQDEEEESYREQLQ